jgi:hypothetical protein
VTRARLDLDLVAPPYQPRWIGLVLLVISLALASALFMRWNDTRAELQRTEMSFSLLAAARPAHPVSRERTEEELRAAQTAIRQLDLPWGRLIRSLERAATPNVAVLAVQPEAQSRLLRVSAETATEGAMFSYLNRLRASDALVDVHLASHQVREDDPRRPLQFSLQARFR